MRKLTFLICIISILLSGCKPKGTFEVGEKTFLLNGEPCPYKSLSIVRSYKEEKNIFNR